MGGNRHTQQDLNNTLKFILKLLNDNDIQNWFIGYGTLLGIIRDNSCINGDDDVDIVINGINYDKMKEILIDNGFIIEYEMNIGESRKILKTKDNDKYCSVDFYMAEVDVNGNFNDQWEHVIWSNCYDINTNKLIEHVWENHKLFLPFNYETKLLNRYGETWRTPLNTKGPYPPKSII
jgi:hypothetical protein